MNPRTVLQAAVIFLAMLGLGSSVPLASAQDTPASGNQAQKEEPVRNTAEWDLPKKTKLAIEGYDPVAYFPEGGGKATKGSKDHEYTYKGVVYRFASREHLELFKQAPARYEPAHGGWCSWAMADEGDKVEIDPKSFIVKDNRLFLFYDGFWGDARKQWLKKNDHEDLATKADQAWTKISREQKRQVKKPGDEAEAAENEPG